MRGEPLAQGRGDEGGAAEPGAEMAREELEL